MREVKDSGIEWVGSIPTHWRIHPVYYYFGEGKNKNRLGQENNLLSLSYGKIVRKDINSSDGLLPESFNTYNIVEADDIIIRPTDLQNDKRSLRTGLVHERGIITSAYICLRPIKKIDSRFFNYQLHAYDVIKVFYNMGNGVRQGLNFSEFSRLLVFEPPINEQKKIADYLDFKCAEIDALISDIQAQIDTLEQYKRSVITEAVTKGLNPDAEMKDSGIEWVGRIPANWIVHPIYTYFIIKLLSAEIVSHLTELTSYSDFAQNAVSVSDYELISMLDLDIERSQLYTRANIHGFVEEPLFSWYIDACTSNVYPEVVNDIVTSLKEVLIKLSLYQMEDLSHAQTNDVLKRFYQNIVPQVLRKSLQSPVGPLVKVTRTVSEQSGSYMP